MRLAQPSCGQAPVHARPHTRHPASRASCSSASMAVPVSSVERSSTAITSRSTPFDASRERRPAATPGPSFRAGTITLNDPRAAGAPAPADPATAICHAATRRFESPTTTPPPSPPQFLPTAAPSPPGTLIRWEGRGKSRTQRTESPQTAPASPASGQAQAAIRAGPRSRQSVCGEGASPSA